MTDRQGAMSGLATFVGERAASQVGRKEAHWGGRAAQARPPRGAGRQPAAAPGAQAQSEQMDGSPVGTAPAEAAAAARMAAPSSALTKRPLTRGRLSALTLRAW